MAWMGGFLVSADAPAPADIGVLLAGDHYAERMSKAVTLLESKLVPRVIVSGPKGSYGTWESDLAIDWAVKQGKPRDWFVPLRMDADSTVEEVKVILPWLREHQIKRILVVTSNYHTRRSGAIWRSLGRDMDIRVVAAPSREFDPDHWWNTRRGQKVFALEWLKTFAWWVGL
jgi:uncharacterized SAM-binding protein YcdF (DUF218 family)